MRLTEAQAAEIKASEAVYRASDLARHYGVNRSTVARIWAGSIWQEVQPSDIPNIKTKTRAVDLAEDINLLIARGMKVDEVAQHLGLSRSTIYAYRGVFIQ